MKTEISSWIYCILNPCSFYEKMIVSACYDEITEEERAELQKHIQTCQKCEEKYKELTEFTGKLIQIKNTLDFIQVKEEIDVLPFVINKITERKERPSPLFKPGLNLAYTLGIVAIVIVSAVGSIFLVRDNEDKVHKGSIITQNSPVDVYEGPLEGQKDKLREIIKNHRGESIAGQALLLLADLEYTSSERYDEAHRLYSELRQNYPRIFSSSSEAVYRYNLLEETKRENFKPLYALNSALRNNDNPVKQLEKIIANYPGTMVANLAVNSLIECVSDSSTANNTEVTIKTLENVKEYLTEPVAIAQVNYILGNLYWNQMRDIEKARNAFLYVIHSDSKQLHPLANEALTQLVSYSER